MPDTPAITALGSDAWSGSDRVCSDDDQAKRAVAVHATVPWDLLADIASQHRDGKPCYIHDKYREFLHRYEQEAYAGNYNDTDKLAALIRPSKRLQSLSAAVFTGMLSCDTHQLFLIIKWHVACHRMLVALANGDGPQLATTRTTPGVI